MAGGAEPAAISSSRQAAGPRADEGGGPPHREQRPAPQPHPAASPCSPHPARRPALGFGRVRVRVRVRFGFGLGLGWGGAVGGIRRAAALSARERGERKLPG